MGLLTRPIGAAFNVVWSALERVYSPVLRSALAHPFLVVVAAGGLLWASVERIPRMWSQAPRLWR